MTGLIWLVLGATGFARHLARWVPGPALLGVVMGLGFAIWNVGIAVVFGVLAYHASRHAWLRL